MLQRVRGRAQERREAHPLPDEQPCGFYRRDQTIDHRVYPKPDSRYGVSKVFGEALGSLYADKYGMEVFMMRIGNVNPADRQAAPRSGSACAISPVLVSIGIDHPDIKFEIVWHLEEQARLVRQLQRLSPGLSPAGRLGVFAEEVLHERPSTDVIAETHQGGVFCTAEEVPNPAAPKKTVKKGKKK